MPRAFKVAALAAVVMGAGVEQARAQGGVDPGAAGLTPGAPAPTAPAGAAPAGPVRPLRFYASTGYDYGTEEFLEVQFEDGSDQSLRTNGGFTLAVGAAFLPLQAGRFETRATIGVKYDSIEASNGSIRYLAFPLELSESLNVKPLRLSLGLSLLLGPNVKGEDFLAGEVEMKRSLGVFGQLEYVLPFATTGGSLSLGLRFTGQTLEAKQGGASWDANAIGAVVGVTL